MPDPKLTPQEYQRLTNLLGRLPYFFGAPALHLLLNNAGLSRFIPSLTPGLPASIAAGELITRLTQFGFDIVGGKRVHVLAMLLCTIRDDGVSIGAGTPDYDFVSLIIERFGGCPDAGNRNGDEQTEVLFVGAQPRNAGAIRIGADADSIRKRLRGNEPGSRFHFDQNNSTDIDELRDLLQRHQPHILHFAGHGAQNGDLVFEDLYGRPFIVETEALAELIRLNKDKLKLLVFNACFSEHLAETLKAKTDCVVIGMRVEMDDEAANQFADVFYLSLGNGRDVQNAFEQGVNGIHVRRLPDHLVPQIHHAKGVDPSRLKF